MVDAIIPLSIASRFVAVSAVTMRLLGGTRSAAFLLDDAFVIRLSSEPDAADRYSNEAVALGLLIGSGTRTPRSIATGNDEGYSWHLTTRVPGHAAHHVWPDLSFSERERLIRSAAEALFGLHSIEVGRFGDFIRPDFATYRELLDYQLANARKSALRLGRFSAGEFDEYAAILRDISDQIPVVSPQFRHGDFHLANVLWDGSDVSFIDFEWSAGGRGVNDLGIGDYQDALAAGSANLLRDAYRDISEMQPAIFHISLLAAELQWKIYQVATRHSEAKASVNKLELSGVLNRARPFANV